MHKPKLGVFGFGQFMTFFTPHLAPYFDIYIYDAKGKTAEIEALGAHAVSLESAASCDYVLLGYPAGSIEQLCQKIAPHLKTWAVVFDICSVQTPAVHAMQQYLPDSSNLLTIHPVFGPQSGKHGIAGLKCMFFNISCDSKIYQDFKSIFSEKLKLQIYEMSPEEHDREMAYIQGLSHFIGRTLKKMNIPDAPLATESYKHLRETSELVGYDSQELFYSIQSDNPYAPEIRKIFLEEIQKLDDWIENQ